MTKTITTYLPMACATFLFVPHIAFAQDSAEQDNTVVSTGTPAPSNSSVRINTGISYSSGNYGEPEDTSVIAIPVSLTYKTSGLRLRVSVPWVMIEGPGSLLATPEGRDAFFGDSGGGQGRGRGRGRGGESSNSGSGSGTKDIEVEDKLNDEVIDDDDVANEDGFAAPDNNRSGFGDVNVSAAYSFQIGTNTYFEPAVAVKLPTASRTKRLGTGEVDVTASADLVQEIGDASFYIHGRRRFAGKPEGSTLQSTWGAGGGASLKVGDGMHIGADYFWLESAFAGRQASSEASGWASFMLGSGLSLTAYGGTGFNDSSADFFGGLAIGTRF